MSWYWEAYKVLKKGKKSDYHYNILETTPLLHGSETLETMYNNATIEQKASIMIHLDNFNHITDELDSYRKIRNKIWDDFS